MRYKILTLCEEYIPEKKDYFHRHKELSKRLYEAWLHSDTDLTFDTWSQSRPGDHTVTDCVLYCDQAELQNKKVHCIEEGLAALEIPALPIFGRPSTMELLQSINPRQRGIDTYALVIPATRDELYAAKMNVKGLPGEGYRIHHSSLAAGGDVRFAAEAILKDGKFTSITDESGHYKPDLYAFVYGLCFIQDSGFDLSSSCIGVTRNTSSGRDGDRHFYDSALNFLSLYRENGFDSSAYCDQEQDNIEHAEKHFIHNQPIEKAIYYIKGENDLYEFTRDSNNNITHVSFLHMYEELYPKTTSAVSSSTDEDDSFFIKRPRLFRT